MVVLYMVCDETKPGVKHNAIVEDGQKDLNNPDVMICLPVRFDVRFISGVMNFVPWESTQIRTQLCFWGVESKSLHEESLKG